MSEEVHGILFEAVSEWLCQRTIGYAKPEPIHSRTNSWLKQCRCCTRSTSLADIVRRPSTYKILQVSIRGGVKTTNYARLARQGFWKAGLSKMMVTVCLITAPPDWTKINFIASVDRQWTGWSHHSKTLYVLINYRLSLKYLKIMSSACYSTLWSKGIHSWCRPPLQDTSGVGSYRAAWLSSVVQIASSIRVSREGIPVADRNSTSSPSKFNGHHRRPWTRAMRPNAWWPGCAAFHPGLPLEEASGKVSTRPKQPP